MLGTRKKNRQPSSEDVKLVSSFSTASTNVGKLLSVKHRRISKLRRSCGTPM